MVRQQYRHLDEVVRDGKLLLPKPREGWRLVRDPLCGHINALESFNGKTIATNGIMVLLEDEVGCFCFGHLQWFVPNEDELNPGLSDLWDEAKTEKPKKSHKSLEELINLI
jgi:hypothetical protein